MKDIIFLQKQTSASGTNIVAHIAFNDYLSMSSTGEDVLDQLIYKVLYTRRGSDSVLDFGVDLMAIGAGGKDADIRGSIAMAIKQADAQIKAMQRGQGYPPEATLASLTTHPTDPITFLPSSGTWSIPLMRKSVSGRSKAITLASLQKVSIEE